MREFFAKKTPTPTTTASREGRIIELLEQILEELRSQTAVMPKPPVSRKES